MKKKEIYFLYLILSNKILFYLYEIINNMKNENKYFECELNRKYMNYKNIFCSPIFFLNIVLKSKLINN